MARKPLSETHPELVAEWHPTLNPDLTPDKVSAGSHKRIWWLGKCGHTWDSDLSSRTYSKSGCPFCSGKSVLAGHNDLATTHPELAAEWHPTKNGDLTPDKKSAGSNDLVWWFGKCGHEWKTWIAGRAIHKTGCSVCGGKIVLAGFNDLESKYPEISAEWHPTKNGQITPDKVFAKSGETYWWLGKCGHEWKSKVLSRTANSTGCGYCSGNNLEIGKSDLNTLRPDLAIEFHPTKNEPLTPQSIFAKSDRVIWWLGKCGHEWRASVKHRNNSESKCPFCSNKKLLASFNDLATTHPELAAEWHPTKNSISPNSVFANSHEKIWWLGKCGHEWQTLLPNRASSQAGCPKCSPGGYSSVDSGILYFIHNPKLLAFKVGITNPGSKNDRLANFKGKGWNVVSTWENDSGRLILETETKFFIWLRREMSIPQMLDKSSIGTPQGATETFSDSILTQAEVISKIEELLRDNT
jgi:hypothetical protein